MLSLKYDQSVRKPLFLCIFSRISCLCRGICLIIPLSQTFPTPPPVRTILAVSVFMAVPCICRAARLIVAHNPEYRYKYARFIKWKPLLIMWSLVAITVVMESALVRHVM